MPKVLVSTIKGPTGDVTPAAIAARDAAVIAREQAELAAAGVPAAVAAAVAATVPSMVDAALVGLDVLTVEAASDTYLRISADAGESQIPTGGSLLTYGDNSTVSPHFGAILGGAHSLTGWPGTADANKRIDGVTGSTSFVRSAVRTVPFAPHSFDMVVLRMGFYDQGHVDWPTGRSAQFQRSLRTMLALLSAETRVEETDGAFTYSGAWSSTSADGNWSAGNNKYTSSVGAYVDVQTPAGKDSYILYGGSNNATGATIAVTDHTAGDALLETISTGATLPAGVSGPIAWRVPPTARGHVIRFTRTAGATSLTIDGMLVQAEAPPLIVFIKNPYLNDYTAVPGATSGSNARIDEGNTIAAGVLAAFPHVKVIDTQADSSWVPGTHMVASGTGYTVAGHARIAALIEAATFTPASGIAGITRDDADERYAPISISEGALRWTDDRIGGIIENPSLASLTDQTAQWNAAMALLSARGGELLIPAGVIGIAGVTAHVPGGAKIVGEGFDYSQPNAGWTTPATSSPPRFGSVIRATAAMDRLVQLGVTGGGGSVAPGVPGGSIYGLSLDGRNLANTVVRTAARRNFIDSCQVYWGAVNGVHFAGQNSYMVGKGVVAQNDIGDCVFIDSYFDHKVFDWELREMGPTGAAIRLAGNVNDVMISRIHTWAGANGIGKPAQGLVVLDAGTGNIHNVSITDCILEGVHGPELHLEVKTGGTIRGLKYLGQNTFNYDTDGTFPLVRVVGDSSGVGGNINEVIFSGNSSIGDNTAGNVWTAFLDYSGTFQSTSAWEFGPNVTRYMATHVLGTPPQLPYFSGSNPVLEAATRRYARWEGRVAQNGGGTTFTIPHSLSRAPRTVTVTPGSADAAADFYVTSDATNITVTYAAARPAGVGNVALNWSASI
ncbi:hypothetical protein [Microbacterium trichothecenolyticum]|uniref:Uncharacterized protein n=1 Tax=Microbacterium trichothecenolyticum TaxID=69370 RepID=A0A0M2H5T7_MICTR|nr:hypothetical protein [Microbacterium trichothecenolyticum]KJL39895.1 hypothetical protein RS82_04108 [Microbacterium trichothecenolyticum]